MTDLLTRDPNDSGEFRLHPSIVETQPRLEVGDGTRDLIRYTDIAATYRRPAAGTDPHDTGELPLWPTGAELAVAARLGEVDPPATAVLFETALTSPSGPSTPPPPQPKPGPPRSWNTPVGHWQIITPEPDPVRPDRWRGRHRREAPLWASLLLHLGADMVGCALGTAAVLLWAVTR